MTNARVPLFLLTLLLTGCATTSRWEPLFNGRNLDGWEKRGGEAIYRVEHGEIIGTTNPRAAKQENTFLCTTREFADFVLEYDFKIDPKLNSGVQIRSHSFPNYDHGRVHGYQVEIDPSERAWTAGIYDEARRGWLCDLKNNEPARKAFRQNQWNHVRVEARGDSIKTWLNGDPAADLHDSLTHSGFIGLQVHASNEKEPVNVRFRKIRIVDLGDKWISAPETAALLVMPPFPTIIDGVLPEFGFVDGEWEQLGKPGSAVEWKNDVNFVEVSPGSGNIVTKKQFADARYHIEFCTDENNQPGQQNGNSGVYIQSRYEVQILNSADAAPTDDNCGAIYKIKKADYGTVRKAGEWQTYDIWFTAPRYDASGQKTSNARMTVYHNGTRIHDNVEVPHTTTAGEPEVAPPGGGVATGPLMLQDHGCKVRFRNVWVAPLTTPPLKPTPPAATPPSASSSTPAPPSTGPPSTTATPPPAPTTPPSATQHDELSDPAWLTLSAENSLFIRDHQDYDAAAKLLERALALDPNYTPAAQDLANLLEHTESDDARAEALFRHCLDLNPNSLPFHANYAHFLLGRRRLPEGREELDRAFALFKPAADLNLQSECWFYRFALGPAEQRYEALAALKHLILANHTQSPACDLTRIVDVAFSAGHPDADWLSALARVVTGSHPDSLAGWDHWDAIAD